MNLDIIKSKEKQLRGDLKKWWGKLTDNDLNQIEGNSNKLLGVLQERYGWSKTRTKKEIDKQFEVYKKQLSDKAITSPSSKETLSGKFNNDGEIRPTKSQKFSNRPKHASMEQQFEEPYWSSESRNTNQPFRSQKTQDQGRNFDQRPESRNQEEQELWERDYNKQRVPFNGPSHHGYEENQKYNRSEPQGDSEYNPGEELGYEYGKENDNYQPSSPPRGSRNPQREGFRNYSESPRGSRGQDQFYSNQSGGYTERRKRQGFSQGNYDPRRNPDRQYQRDSEHDYGGYSRRNSGSYRPQENYKHDGSSEYSGNPDWSGSQSYERERTQRDYDQGQRSNGNESRRQQYNNQFENRSQWNEQAPYNRPNEQSSGDTSSQEFGNQNSREYENYNQQNQSNFRQNKSQDKSGSMKSAREKKR